MTKQAAVFNDLSGFGKCSLTAAIPILSVMGISPCPIPTAVLTNQTGFDRGCCVDFTEHMKSYAQIWGGYGESFDGIYSGYIANIAQIDIISGFIRKFKKSYTKVLVDPVMGDEGKLYSAYDRATCQRMCELAKSADIITPNLTELCIIADEDFQALSRKSEEEGYLELVARTARKCISFDSQSIVVTGVKRGGCLYNGVITKDDDYFVGTKQYGGGYSGTGDIFASIICGCAVNGVSLKSAAKTATDFISRAVLDTLKEPIDRNYGINFEKFLYTLHSNEQEELQ